MNNRIPRPQLLRLASITSSPLNPLNSQFGCLPHNLHFLLVVPPSLEQLQTPVKAKRTQSFGRLMPAHIILRAILDTCFQKLHSLGLTALAQAVCELVLQERRR